MYTENEYTCVNHVITVTGNIWGRNKNTSERCWCIQRWKAQGKTNWISKCVKKYHVMRGRVWKRSHLFYIRKDRVIGFFPFSIPSIYVQSALTDKPFRSNLLWYSSQVSFIGNDLRAKKQMVFYINGTWFGYK